MSGSPCFYLLSEPLPKAVIEECMMYDKGHGRGLVVCGKSFRFYRYTFTNYA